MEIGGMKFLEWRFFKGKYGTGWYTPFIRVENDQGQLSFQVTALRWFVAIARVHTTAFWAAQFDEYEKEAQHEAQL